MKTTGVSCETKFGLLVFLGHPTGDALFLPSGCMQHRERRRLGCVLEDADKGPVEAQLPPPAHHQHCSAHCSSGKSTDVANTTLSVVPAVCLASITVPVTILLLRQMCSVQLQLGQLGWQ